MIRFQFLDWDDPELLTRNPWFLNPSWKSVAALWNPLSLWKGSAQEYAPIRDLTYLLDRILWGWNPAPFHLMQLLLHSLNAVLLFHFLRRRASLYLAILGALLWAFHPLTIEPVAWISGRKDLLMVTGMLGAFLLYDSRPDCAFLSGLFALLSKYSSIVVGPIVGAMARIRNEKFPILLVLFLTLLAKFLALFVFFANAHIGSLVKVSHTKDVFQSWPAAFSVIPHNLEAIFWPTALSARYVQSPWLGWEAAEVWMGFILAIVIGALVFVAWRKMPLFAEGLVIFTMSQFPTFLQISVGHPIWMADRYLYLPLIGVAISIVAWVEKWGSSIRKFALLPLVPLSLLTWNRLPVWHDSYSLWRATSEASPTLYYVWGNLSHAEQDREDWKSAKASMERGLRLNPDWAKGWGDLAQIEIRLGNVDRAKAILKEVDSDSNLHSQEEGWIPRADAYLAMGYVKEAEPLLEKALIRYPESSLGWANYGTLLAQTGREKDALKAWGRALDIYPGEPTARINRARYWFLKGNCQEMQADLSKMDAPSERDKSDSTWLQAHCLPRRESNPTLRP